MPIRQTKRRRRTQSIYAMDLLQRKSVSVSFSESIVTVKKWQSEPLNLFSKWIKKKVQVPAEMATATEPYFFEKYFPASYHITFTPPIQRQATNIPKDELERRSSISEKEFHVLVDVQDFQPEEITVKTVDELVTVEAKQAKRPGVVVPRHFVRNFQLPPLFDSEDVTTSISENGILELKAIPSTQKKFKHLEELKALDNVNPK